MSTHSFVAVLMVVAYCNIPSSIISMPVYVQMSVHQIYIYVHVCMSAHSFVGVLIILAHSNIPAPEASWSRVFDPCTPPSLLFDLYYVTIIYVCIVYWIEVN